MLLIFKSFVSSLFSEPYIKTITEEKGILNIRIFNKERECGYIVIQKENVKYYISNGIKLGKGIIKISEIELIYERKSILLKSLNRNKKILKVRCNEIDYVLIKRFLENN